MGSGQLLAFYLVSLFWGGDLILRENLLNVASIWETYPHNNMTFLLKFFFIIQISYWLHIFPELYFQKIKKEDMPPRIQYAVLYLAFIVSAYFLRFTRLALVLLVIHYISEAIFHVCRLLAYSEKTSISNKLFKFGDLVFVLARLSSVILSVLTFWFGLAKLPAEQQVFDLETGNFNTGLIRLNSLIAVCLLQAFLMWNFIVCQFKRMRRLNPAQALALGQELTKEKQNRKKQRLGNLNVSRKIVIFLRLIRMPRRRQSNLETCISTSV